MKIVYIPSPQCLLVGIHLVEDYQPLFSRICRGSSRKIQTAIDAYASIADQGEKKDETQILVVRVVKKRRKAAQHIGIVIRIRTLFVQ